MRSYTFLRAKMYFFYAYQVPGRPAIVIYNGIAL